MKKEEFIFTGLLEQYAFGATSPDESLLVEDFLSQYPDLKQELNEIEEALELYAMQNAQKPSANVKDTLMHQLFPAQNKSAEQTIAPIISQPVSKVVNMEANKKTGSFYKLASAAMLVLLVGSIAFAYYFYQQFHQTKNELATAQQSIEEQQKLNESLTGNLDIVTDKYAQSVFLKGTPQAPNATAKIFWMKNTGQVYVDYRDLPAPPSGKQYQLWAIVDGKPVDAGMINTEKGTYSIQKMKTFGKADAFAITLEKSGGSPTPTMSEMVVISEL